MAARKTSRNTRTSKKTRQPRGRKRTARAVAPDRPSWGLLIYLAGDTEYGAEDLHADLEEILGTRLSPDLAIAAQYDGPDGASRYVVTSDGRRGGRQAYDLGRVDSGRPPALLDFLRWGVAQCQAERLALVIGSPLAVPPGEPSDDPERTSVFSLTHDQGSGNYLDVCELAGVIRDALGDSDRERIDILAIDSCHVQFLELAYELEDVVHVLIAPQTMIPIEGWDYRRVLKRWQALAKQGGAVATTAVARELLDEIADCYQRDRQVMAVSALDLERLDEVARAFDTLCMATLQVLGEGLIWTARRVLVEELHDTTDSPVYDCGSFFALWEAVLEAIADEAYQGWLGTSIVRASGHELDRFCDAVARHLTNTLDEDPDGTTLAPEVADRLMLVAETLMASDRLAAGTHLLEVIGEGVKQRVRALVPGTDPAERGRARELGQAREQAVRAAVSRAVRLLPEERQFDLARLEDSATNALTLAQQARRAMMALLGNPKSEIPGMVVAMHRHPPQPPGWPRWSGVSIYRPQKLDELMNVGYQRFAFHRRVHWAALLGAANLIDQHPRALWRLVSSLLGTGSAQTRRDVLRRLTGYDSVAWGLRSQFQAMAPAPSLTLSLERRSATMAGTPGPRESYLLRLESVTRGAVISEQDSRVQPKVLDRALHELDALLQRDRLTTKSLRDLRAIGGLLGEDIFQSLGRTLEEQRDAVRAENPSLVPHLQLQIPRELMKYPWELLHHHGEWLGERYAMGRQVFMETGLARRVPARRLGRVKPLVIGDPIFDRDVGYRQLPGARAEAEQVAGWFERTAEEVGSIIEFDRAKDTRIHCRLTIAEMRALLREGTYDIVHFAGHGVFRADDPETSAWLLSDGELWSLEIRNTLAEHPAPPWLVYANACEAGMDGGRVPSRYQGNVFGLATAFINQGVAAYIGPLWPIDDLLAQRLALEFYQHLLSGRATLGEALRRAKASARALAYPPGVDDEPDDAAWAGLGWASLVLYGDPTEELFQALAGGSHQSARPEGARGSRPEPSSGAAGAGPVSASTVVARPVAPALLHAPDHVVSDWVRGPNWKPAVEQRSAGAPADHGTAVDQGMVLELIEDAGLRRWRVRRPDAAATGTRGSAGGDGLPGSPIAALLADDRTRSQLPGRRGIVRVIGRWVLSGFDDGLAGLARQYDREQVRREGLLVVDRSGTLRPASAVPRAAADAGAARTSNRALLLVHGTFSKTASPVEGLGPEFLAWAADHYRAVLGFDHWTLSKAPDENARLLVDELRGYDASLLRDGNLDIISHSRGGLVARAFVELLDQAEAVRHLVFVGTPNCGTDLANPKNWGAFADLLVNMTGLDGAELLGRLSGLLAQLAIGGGVANVPGLLAQSPETVAQAGSFLRRLQDPAIDRSRVRYHVVCAEFEPTALIPNLKQMVKAAALAGVDTGLDALFASANDLVVNTPYAWGVAAAPADVGRLPAFVPPERVLLYRPPVTDFKPPHGVTVETALGVHHCNLFAQARVRETIKAWLTEPVTSGSREQPARKRRH